MRQVLRCLPAIMFTDMVGYSASTQRNEELALELLEGTTKLNVKPDSRGIDHMAGMLREHRTQETAGLIKAGRCDRNPEDAS